MCASVYSSLLLLTLTTVSMLSTRMATEGLPLYRQERGADRGLLTGADFLSVFMGSSREEITTTSTTPQPITETASYTRATRSTNTQPDEPSYFTTLSAHEQSSDSSSGDAVIVAVDRTLDKRNEDATTTEFVEQSLVASEDHPSIVAEANKSEFSVEESEPITTNSELNVDFRAYPASVQPLNPQFNFDLNKEKIQPIQHSIIYHNNPREPGRARSVSYSTVIQAVPQEEKTWEDDKHERRERHFDGQTAYNIFQNEDKVKQNATQVEKVSTTERSWEIPEKPYVQQRLPTVYGKPEQNYEVDESASVMTNGRVHGIQPSPTLPSKQEIKIGESKKVDDNQKVGYVVEGRNYRKYRVEERTSDGFIVGEYGVVSHNDGSLRGVRYTADGTISPRLIYDALMKFLSL